MNTFLPTKRRTSSSKKTFSTSFLRMAYGSIFALLLLMSGGVFGQYSGTGTFTKITSLTDLTDGYYVIANETDAFLMTNGRSGTATAGYFVSAAVSPSSGVITNPSQNNVWKIETNGSGRTIYNEVIAKYVGWSSGNAASIEDTPANTNRWTFSYSSSKFTVLNVATAARQLSYNAGAPRFAAYSGSGQQELQLYKYAPSGFTVTFNNNGGSGTMTPQTASTATALTTNTFTKNNNVFAGWNTAIDGSGTAYADGASYDFDANVTLYAQWTPITTTLANNGTPVAAGNVTQGTNNDILGSFTLAQSGADATLTQATFLIDGNFVNGDVAANGIKLYTSATNNFATATSIGSLSVTEPDVITFSGLTQTLTKDATRYFWVTADIAIGATPGNTINLYQMNHPDLVVSTGTISGSTTVSGEKTIVSTPTPTLSVTPTTLPDFGTTCINTDSAIQTYTLTGVNLSGDVTVTAPAGFKVRKGTEAFAGSTTVTPVSGSINIPIDVIFSPTTAPISATYSIQNSGGGAALVITFAPVSSTNGTVAVATETANTILTTTATSGGSSVSTSCGTITAKGVVWDTAENPTVALSTKTNDGTGVANYSSNITGLTENTVYNVRAYATNSNAVTSYGANSTFTTLSKAPTAPIANTATVNGFTASWTAPASQGNEALTYTIKIYSNAALTTQVGSAITGITTTSTVIASLSQNTTYYYTVEAVNATGSSAVASFTTGITTLSGPCHTEDFSGLGTISAYSNGSWTGAGGTWNVTDGRSDQTITDKAITFRDGVVTSPSFSDGIGSLTVTTKYPFSDGTGTIKLFVNNIEVGTLNVSTTAQTQTISNINVGGSIVLEFRNTSATKRPAIDNLNWTCFVDCVAPTVTLQATPVTAITTETVSLHGNVTAQGDFAINTRGFEYSVNNTMSAALTKSSPATATGTYSENITGLTPNTVYYYRAYATNDCNPNKTGYSHTSDYPTFTTVHNAPNVGTGTDATSTSFTAQWTAPTGGGSAAFTYEIQVDDDSNFGSVNFTANSITGISTLVNSGLTASTTYYYRVRAVNAGGNSAWSATSLGYATTAPAPEIKIKIGSTSIGFGINLSFDSQISGTTGSENTLIIENSGDAPLSVGALSISGTDAASFIITQPLSATVAAGGTTTFTVTFAPTTMGSKTAQLSLINGDADENPFLINLFGTGTANASSDIITDNTFTYATNIDYKNYITADITAANSIELGRFIIRDGGTGDADNVGTTLNSLGVTVGNAANLERLAIYDGATEIAEMPATATTNFSGLSLFATDNGTKTFTIRGSFKTAVTDNQRIQLTVASATASATGSGFGTISATTSTIGTDNVIVVTANGLGFITQPTTTTINVAMATVVVAATDLNANVDVDVTGPVSIFSTGTLTGSPVAGNLVAGVASFTTLTHTVAETGRMLFASASGLITGGSSLFDITTVANGTYETTAPGNWPNATGAATWKRMVAGSWVPNTTPGSNTTDLLIIKHTITTNGAFASSGGVGTQIQVESGGIFNNGHTSTLKSLQINAGGTYSVNASGAGILATTGTLTVESGGKLILNSDSISSVSAIWSGVENFKSGSTVEVNNWNYGATGDTKRLIQNPSSISNNPDGYHFGNLKITGAPSSIFTMVAGGETVNLCQNDFTSNVTGSNATFTNSNAKVTIGGNIIIEGGSLSATATGTTGATVNALGGVSVNAGTFNLNQQSSSAASVVNIGGDLYVAPTATLTSTNNNSILNFSGNGDGETEATTQTINVSNPNTSVRIAFNTNSGSYVKLINQNFVLGSGSKFTVENGSTFDFGLNGSTALNIQGPSFESKATGIVKITSPEGIASSGATGNVQTTTRTFGAADYQYTGIENQITGAGLPTSGAKITIANTGTAPDNEVRLTNESTSVSALEITNGVFNLNEKTLTGTNLSIAENATLKIVGTQSFPSFTNKTFHNNGIVEYGGSNQSIAALTSPTYTKLKVSGTGKKVLSGTSVEVGNNLNITSSLLEISEGQTLRVHNEISTVDTDATNGLFIKNGGSLVQIANVDNQSSNINVGKIKMERITKPMYRLDYTYWSAPVSGNTLVALSPNSPANRFFHWNPDAVSPAPNWAVITGGTAQMLPGKGYIIRAPTVGNGTDASNPASYTPYTGNFNGKPNNGTVTTPISGPEKWNLIGNPYPSAIDAEKFLDDNDTTLDGTLYFWTHNTPLSGASGYGYSSEDYAAWNGTGSLATVEALSDTDPADNKPKGFIAAGQSFFVKGEANGNAVFTNSMRENANNMQFFRSSNTENTTEKHRIWLNLKGAEKGFSQTLVGYVSNATNGQDNRFDGELFGGNAVTFYSVMENKNWSIQGRALPFTTADEVPLGYKTTLTGTLIINIDDRDGQLANQNIYLKDNLLNVVHNLTDGPYNFTSTPGTYDDRFVLRYLPGENLDNPSFEDQMNGLTIRKNNADIHINSSFENIDAVLIYDIMGRLLFEKEKCNTQTFKTSNVTQSEQMLIIKVRLNNGAVVTKKVW